MCNTMSKVSVDSLHERSTTDIVFICFLQLEPIGPKLESNDNSPLFSVCLAGSQHSSFVSAQGLFFSFHVHTSSRPRSRCSMAPLSCSSSSLRSPLAAIGGVSVGTTSKQLRTYSTRHRSSVSLRRPAVCGLKRNWDGMYDDLVSKEFKSVTPDEAMKMAGEG